jgi:hypothetical protein
MVKGIEVEEEPPSMDLLVNEKAVFYWVFFFNRSFSSPKLFHIKKKESDIKPTRKAFSLIKHKQAPTPRLQR